MKWRSAVVVMGAWAWAALACAQAPDLEHMDFVLKSVPDGPVAKVNGKNIPSDEFTRLYQTESAALAQSRGRKSIPDQVRLETGLRCLTVLIQREILFQEALKRKLTVSDKEIEQGWQDELLRVSKHLSKQSDTPPTEKEFLERAGLSREEALAEIRKEMLIARVRDALVEEEGVTVTDAELAAFFEEKKNLFRRPDRCHLKQVFVGFGPERSAADPELKLRARSKIEKAMQRIRAGESFEAVAKFMSEAPGKEQGGDMGMMPMVALPPFYADAAYTLEPGQTSDIIESELGFHVIKLVEFLPGAAPNLEKAKPLIRKMLLAKKSKEVVVAFCKPVLGTEGAVQVFLELEKTLETHPAEQGLRSAVPGAVSDPSSKP